MAVLLQSLLVQWEVQKKTPIIEEKKFSSILKTLENGHLTLHILGTPIVKDKIDREGVARFLLESKNPEKDIASLNGEFCIYLWDNAKNSLKIFTDRFASYPVFWANTNSHFYASYNYMDLAETLKKLPEFKLLPERAFEFLQYRRLFNGHTHDNLSQCLAPGSCLTIEAGKAPILEKYWAPNYEKSIQSKKALIHKFSDLFEHSVKVRQDGDDVGIFLSGGHDSRTVAMYADKPATCFTLSFSDNLEVDVARKIAAASGHSHKFCQIEDGFFEKTHDLATNLGGAMYVNENSLFFPVHITPPPTANVLLHGHGLDYMYQGMYLNARAYHISGRQTYIRKFLPFPDDMVSYFMDRAPSKMKYEGLEKYLTNDFKDYISTTFSTLYDDAKALSDDPHDQWEYLILHQISQHHTFSNVLSKRACGEVRTPSFDNDLYDFYLSLPHTYRLHGDILRGAMYYKDRHIANTASANHGLPAGWGPYARTSWMITRKLLRHASMGRAFHVPGSDDRTWPDLDTHMRTNESYRNKALACLADKDFQDLISFIDWKKLKLDYEQVLREKYGGQFFTALFSYYSFFKKLYP
ncbi:MAG: hypothetical protein KTR28_02550 [Micavibrio sp.]|nr:hypothetical protein [Micavibrio sp.]